MPYDHDLAHRIRQHFATSASIVEKAMFGGVAFLLNGNLCVGVWKSSLVARVGPDEYQRALMAPHAGKFDITGREMTGWVLIAADGVATVTSLADWIDRARSYVETLPPKSAKSTTKPTRTAKRRPTEKSDIARPAKRKRSSVPATVGATFDTVRSIARTLDGVSEGTSYGTPAFRAGKTLFVRLHDSHEALVVRMDPAERAVRMQAAPETYYITDHYANYPWVLVRLAAVDEDDLRDVLQQAWRLSAPKPRAATKKLKR